MRLQYVAVVAAAALAATTDGLQIAPNSATSYSLRASADARYPPYVEGKGDRFLISESTKEDATPTQTGYEFSTLQEENDVLQEAGKEDDDDDYEDESESGSSSEERAKKRKWWQRKKKKKNKATETPTPTPTSTPEGMTATPTPTPTPTPAPTTKAPAGLKKFVDLFRRVFGD